MSAKDDFSRLVTLVRAGLGFETDFASLEDQEESIWAMARDHKVSTILSPGVLQSDSVRKFVDEARYFWQMAALREEFYAAKCKELQDDFQEKGITSFPLKGMVLATQAYPMRGQRPFRDLDLLVKPSDLVAADEVLKTKGFTQIYPKGPLKRGVAVKGDPIRAAAAGIDALSYQEGEIFLELHTSIVPPMLGNYPVDESWDDVDFLNHLLFHSTRHHFLFGLRHLVDVAVWSHTKKISWQDVLGRLEERRMLFLAWPTWKLSQELFPETIDLPPAAPSSLLAAYTDRVREQLSQMPTIAIDLAGSPLPFLWMKPNRLRSLFQMVFGSKVHAEYQLGEGKGWWRRTLWRVRRPFGLLWRHAPVCWKWVRFTKSDVRA